MATSTISGYPRIGGNRELKKALEQYWSGRIAEPDLLSVAANIRVTNLTTQRNAGIDLVPVNDFSFYDQVLDTTALVGNVPARYGWSGDTVDLETYFAMARGRTGENDIAAMEMTKWFDTNYHYIVPEFSSETTFTLSSTKPFDALAEAQAAGVDAKVVLLGPVTYLLLGKSDDDAFAPLSLLDRLLPVYEEVLSKLAAQGAGWIQLDEPILVTGVDAATIIALKSAYARLKDAAGNAKIIVNTYFDHVADIYQHLVSLPVDGFGFDFVRGGATLNAMQEHGFPAGKTLVAGVVDGRNVWRNDLRTSLSLLQAIGNTAPEAVIQVSSSCSLQHVPITIEREKQLDDEVKSWLAFANEKLTEIAILTRGLTEGEDAIAAELAASDALQQASAASTRRFNPTVRQRVATLTPADADRGLSAAQRAEIQTRRLNLPLLPTTTIGSFPQVPELRAERLKFDKGEISQEEYEAFLEQEIRDVIDLQENLGIDVLVHGEPERNDMVQYFGEQLDGFAFTRYGWVQSYGSRYVRPPLIFGDVSRPHPITVRWATFAQSLSDKPVKGMLTGPVTILNWSFVRDDQPRSDTCLQIALAIRDEVVDLETAGIAIIQIDEAALREGLPLRRENWQHYLDWAVNSFRITASGVKPETQIHTHMCYSEFGDIFQAISDLDADVISIENARSGLELLETFRSEGYDKGIGPGVYDIHSPRVPPTEEIVDNLHRTLTVLDVKQVWVNPDCGLKTRKSPETTAALTNMVDAARKVRETIS
ncbi:MAG: 5-methyltetrahydropteroyltriglutamate--homocysteine S-methyltransferase [Thermomicrobiales bacterium]|nr:5-methyltetrahydropteroyltriglutamate--homocysteine S-methyltransferase [Thermomicrobiales bacterium]